MLVRKIAALRARGVVVIEELPGHEKFRSELGCTRRLAKKAGKWVLVPLVLVPLTPQPTKR
jgi:ATP phosphoribosyltransferase regulatory subunit